MIANNNITHPKKMTQLKIKRQIKINSNHKFIFLIKISNCKVQLLSINNYSKVRLLKAKFLKISNNHSYLLKDLLGKIKQMITNKNLRIS